jgi:hypothetical protein
MTPDPALALWDPVVDVAGYWASAKRNSRIWRMKRTGRWREPEALIEAHGDAVVSEMLVTRRLLDSLAEIGATIRLPGNGTSPAILVSAGPDTDNIASILGPNRPVATYRNAGELGWGTRDQRRAVETTISWMKKSLG